MTLFFIIWLVLVAAAGGLAIGTLWGRLPPRGSCATRARCAVRCEGCTHTSESRRDASGSVS